ncbi:MAG: HAD family hydrolase [Dehalococcoidia bacterium]
MMEAVCFDLGDTLIAEESVVHNMQGKAVAADIVEGVPEVLQAVRDRGFKTAIIANADSTSGRNVIDHCELGGYFDIIVISGEIGSEKPAREIFQFALDELAVKANDAIMVGNRIDVDIVGANRIGMKTVWFKWNDRYEYSIDPEEAKPNFTISNMPELLGILDLIMKKEEV